MHRVAANQFPRVLHATNVFTYIVQSGDRAVKMLELHGGKILNAVLIYLTPFGRFIPLSDKRFESARATPHFHRFQISHQVVISVTCKCKHA